MPDPVPTPIANARVPAFLSVTNARIDQQRTRRLMIVLRTNGCAYDEQNRGCSMCDFKRHAIRRQDHVIAGTDLMAQLMTALLRLDESVGQVDLLTLGSFLHEWEVPGQFRVAALREIGGRSHVERLLVESRAPYITEVRLKELRDALGSPQRLEVGIGVESSDDRLRNAILNKHLRWDELARVMQLCARMEIGVVTYLLIKPHTLDEKGAIEDATRSAREVAQLARACGVRHRVAFEPVFITRGTALEREFLEGRYQLLNLWSIIEVARESLVWGPLFFGMSDEGLSDNRKPWSCELCGERIMAAIEEFNGSNDLAAFEGLDCPCRVKWARNVGRG